MKREMAARFLFAAWVLVSLGACSSVGTGEPGDTSLADSGTESDVGSGDEDAPVCGDEKQEGTEQCDAATANGTVCTAAYNGTCTYCSTSCSNVTVTGPHCGDGNCDAGHESAASCAADCEEFPPLSTTIPVPTTVEHRLTLATDATTFSLTIDARTRLHPAAKLAGGVSFFTLGWENAGAPWSGDGATYKLTAAQDQAVRDLRLPSTRTYHMAGQSFGLNSAIDKLATLTTNWGIPRETTVLEFEAMLADTVLTPEQWKAGIQHSLDSNYGFHHWEISNEPYRGWDSGLCDRDTYVEHVKSISDAIRSVDDHAIIGAHILRNASWWNDGVMQKAAGKYDFVIGHYYSFIDPDPSVTPAIEDVALADNYMVLTEIARNNDVLVTANPGRDVYQYDTEWGNSAGVGSAWADYNGKNANINGALHRAVRMLYYAREGLLRGANSWVMLGSTTSSGFALMPVDSSKLAMIYWVYYYFNRHMGDWVLDISGTTKSYTATVSESPDEWEPGTQHPRDMTVTGPVTPAMATLSADGTTLYLMVVNGSWTQSFPMHVNLLNFTPNTATAVVLSHGDRNASPLVNKAEFVSDFTITVDGPGHSLSATLPPHAIVFATVTRAP